VQEGVNRPLPAPGLHLAINQYLKQKKWNFTTLKNAEKKELITPAT
jgi:hypothetical protein